MSTYLWSFLSIFDKKETHQILLEGESSFSDKVDLWDSLNVYWRINYFKICNTF